MATSGRSRAYEETVGQLIYDLGNKQWDIPKLRDLLETILPQKTTFDDYEVEHDFATIGRRIMLLNARQIKRGMGKERIILLAIEDITERRRLEDLLTESEERYRRLFETANDGIVLLEKREGNITHANPAAEKMLGYSKEEYIGKKLQDIGVSIDMSDFPAIMQSLNRCGIINYNNVLVKTRSGQDIYTDIYMVDRAKLAQCNIRDVTERKQKEEDIQRLHRTLLARSKSSKALIRADDEAWYLNEVCRIIVEDCGHALVWIGFAEHDEDRTVRPVAHSGFDEGYLDSLHITWSDSERGRGPVGTAIRTGKPSIFGDILRDPTFAPWREEAVKRGYAAVIGVPLLTEGKAFGSLNIYSRFENPFSSEEIQLLTDLAADLSYGIAAIRRRTAQAEAEAALRESERRYKSLVETTVDGVFQSDPEGVFTFINESGAGIFGYGAPDEMIGMSANDYWADPGKRDAYLAELKNRKTLNSFPVQAKKKDGVDIQLEISSRIIEDYRGRFIGIEGILRDVTEKNKLESQLRHAQKMEAVGTLAGGVAHDFNNILTAIIGYGHLVKIKMRPDDLQQDMIDQILSAADRAALLTKGLLAFSRKQITNPKPVDLNDIVRNIDKLLRRVIGEDIDLSTLITGNRLIAMADTGQIEQVLMNLATNARDAMPEGGALTIKTEEIELGADFITAHGYGKPGKYALISISDTGAGMNEATREKIFEPFFTTKELGKGTGLGLAIVYGIVKQHEGTINVYSEPGKGTTFRIYIPLSLSAIDEARTERAKPPRGGTETILLAEDDEQVRKLTENVLRDFGYRVIAAVDGQDALEKFARQPRNIDLLILDVIMPKKSGKEVYDAVKAERPDAKVLFISGYTADILHKKGIFEEGIEFLSKPSSPYDLLRKIRVLLDNHRQSGS